MVLILLFVVSIVRARSSEGYTKKRQWARIKDYYVGDFDISSIPQYYDTKHPLSKVEILQLSAIRRINYINAHFAFLLNGVGSKQQYRGSLNNTGRWDCIKIEYKSLFSFLTDLLKYKRHEWFIYMLADEFEAKLLWAMQN